MHSPMASTRQWSPPPCVLETFRTREVSDDRKNTSSELSAKLSAQLIAAVGRDDWHRFRLAPTYLQGCAFMRPYPAAPSLRLIRPCERFHRRTQHQSRCSRYPKQ